MFDTKNENLESVPKKKKVRTSARWPLLYNVWHQNVKRMKGPGKKKFDMLKQQLNQIVPNLLTSLQSTGRTLVVDDSLLYHEKMVYAKNKNPMGPEPHWSPCNSAGFLFLRTYKGMIDFLEGST